MHSTVQNKGGICMNNEKIYKTMAVVGAGDLSVGIVVLVTGIVAGVLLIINGARLLKGKSDLIF
jgi:hypothetical protein